jgi:hypothetical protein
MLQIEASLTIVIGNAGYGYEAKVKHINSTSVIYDHHLQLSKYVYNSGHRSNPRPWDEETSVLPLGYLNRPPQTNLRIYTSHYFVANSGASNQTLA